MEQNISLSLKNVDIKDQCTIEELNINISFKCSEAAGEKLTEIMSNVITASLK